MPQPAALPGGSAHIIDTGGFGIERYCGVFALEGEDGVALIETGPSTTVEAVTGGLDQLGIELEEVTHLLPTHIHLDHGGALWRMLELCPNATAYVHEVGAPFITDEEKVAKLLTSVERAVGSDRFPQYGTFQAVDPDRIVEVSGGEKLTCAGRTVELVDAPGHAPHQYAVHDPENGIVYAGDALGIRTPNGPVLQTSPPPAFDLAAWRGTLDALEALEADWFALTHFGWVDARTHLPQFREHLEAWVDEVARHAEAGKTREETLETLLDEHDEGLSVYDEATWRHEVAMNTTGVWLWLKRQRG